MTPTTPLALPDGPMLLTDGGLETTLIFHEGFDLPSFAAFPLLASEPGRDALRRYYRAYLAIARRHGLGIILETATWRASADWGALLGYDAAALRDITVAAVDLLRELRDAEAEPSTVLISGCVGPRGDGYSADLRMTPDEAAAYHHAQIATLAAAGVDLVSAHTITHVEEAIGIVRAGASVDVATVMSFTVEVDGRLPSGQPLTEAILQLDDATDAGALHLMVNCAHPTHLEAALDPTSPALARLRGFRANASTMSHAELDEAEALDAGDPHDLAQRVAALTATLPALTVLGGCCGTDDRHIAAIAAACAPR